MTPMVYFVQQGESGPIKIGWSTCDGSVRPLNSWSTSRGTQLRSMLNSNRPDGPSTSVSWYPRKASKHIDGAWKAGTKNVAGNKPSTVDIDNKHRSSGCWQR